MVVDQMIDTATNLLIEAVVRVEEEANMAAGEGVAAVVEDASVEAAEEVVVVVVETPWDS